MSSNNQSELYTLHIIFSIQGWELAQNVIEPTDRVLLVQDACYLSQQDLAKPHALFARSKDIKARNIKAHPHIEIIDDETWVTLTEHAHNTMSW